MKTKIQIIQSLLDERKITAEEALTLMSTEKEVVYVPTNVPWNTWPYYYNPSYPIVTCGSTTGGDSMIIKSMEYCN